MNKPKKFNFQNLQIALIYLFGFLSVALIEFVSINSGTGGHAAVSFEFTTFIKRLPSTIASYVALISYTSATLMYCVNKFMDKDEGFVSLNMNIKECSLKVFSPELFLEFCNIKNRKRKIRAYKYRITKQFNKLEKHQTDADIMSWAQLRIDLKENPDTVPTNIYCQKRLDLEKKLTDEYIEEHINNTQVSYDKITYSVIFGGVDSSSRSTDDTEAYVTKSKALKVTSDRAPSTIFTFAITFTITTLTVDAIMLNGLHWTAWLTFAIKMIVKIGTMINTVCSTYRYSRTYNQQVTLKDAVFRWGICNEYINWLQSKKETKNGSGNNSSKTGKPSQPAD